MMLERLRNTLALVIGIAWSVICFWVLVDTCVGISNPPIPRPGILSQRPEQQSTSQGTIANNGSNTSFPTTTPGNRGANSPNDTTDQPNNESTYEGCVMLVTNGFIAFFTLLAAIAAWGVYFVYKKMGDDANAANRAYVALGDPPNRQHGGGSNPIFITTEGDDHLIQMRANIINWGKTPAQVGPASFSHVIATAVPIPRPPHSGTKIETSYAFVMPNESIAVNDQIRLSKSEWESLQIGASPQQSLWILGYVEYLDQFKDKHVGHYGRRCLIHPASGYTGPDHLTLTFEATEGYNYDEKRKD